VISALLAGMFDDYTMEWLSKPAFVAGGVFLTDPPVLPAVRRRVRRGRQHPRSQSFLQ
jgi:hypothetical protein